MTDSPKKRFDPVNLTAAALLAATAAVNVVSAFFLPEKLPALVSSPMSSLAFLIAGILLVGVSGAMAVFGPSKKRWIVTEALLTAMDIVVVAVNLFRF